jgi:RHS repeat-associated protein
MLEATDGRGTTLYEYDVEGNLSRKVEPDGRAWTYEWDAVGMLVKVIRPDGLVVQFGYDAFGRRVWKRFRGRITRWIWDRDVPLHEWQENAPGGADAPSLVPVQTEASSDAQAKRRDAELVAAPAQGPPDPAAAPGTAEAPITWLFVPGTFTPIAKLSAGRTFGIVTDHLGVPVRMYDGEGDQVWAADPGIHGDLHRSTGDPSACPFRWPGQYEDSETGLHYNRFRYYAPEVGEYISQDPLGLRARLELYQYARDPLVERDPLGLIDENEPGYGTYVIADKNTGEPIYVGATNDFARRESEHLDSGRYDPDNHVFVPVQEDISYGEARGAEQALMEDLGTKTKGKRGVFPNNIVDSVSEERLTNPSNARERVFADAYEENKGVTKETALAKISKACGK